MAKTVSQKLRRTKRFNPVKNNYGNAILMVLKFFKFYLFYVLLIKRILKRINYYKNTKFKDKKKYLFYLYANYPCRKKSKNARMGKGIGSFLTWAVLIRPSTPILELLMIESQRIIKFEKKLKKRLNRSVVFKYNSTV